MKSESLNVVFTPEEDAGGFTVTVPAVPECITYGATFSEAVLNLHEALALCLEVRQSENKPIPEILKNQTLTVA